MLLLLLIALRRSGLGPHVTICLRIACLAGGLLATLLLAILRSLLLRDRGSM